MAKQKPTYVITTYGVYKNWDERSKLLPEILEFTSKITAKENLEFGFTLNAKKAKGQKLTYTIFHPDIPDEQGQVMAPFIGNVYVDNNNWDFYLGDSIWLPLHNKLGTWRMVIELNGKMIAEKKFDVSLEQSNSFMKKHGY